MDRGRMNISGILLLELFVVYMTVLQSPVVSDTCADVDEDCNARASVGDCWFVMGTQCRCSLSCNAPPLCDPANNDTDCLCFSIAKACSADASYTTMCPTTCDRRANIVCETLPTVAYATPSVTSPRYGDQVTFTCNDGYKTMAGSTGLRICINDGIWFSHTTDGDVPVCDAVSCGAPPVVHNFVPSKAVGSYGDIVGYSCPANTVPMDGGTAQYRCNASGLWEKDVLGVMPRCKETEVTFRNSVAEISGAAPPNTSHGRTNVDCARQCALMDSCHGYTFSREFMACSFNTAAAVPVTTEMKAI